MQRYWLPKRISWDAHEDMKTNHEAQGALLDHTRLTYRHNGIQRRLTDVHGQVIREILA